MVEIDFILMEGDRPCQSRNNDKPMITFDVSGEVTSGSPEWKKCDVIAKVIANWEIQDKVILYA